MDKESAIQRENQDEPQNLPNQAEIEAEIEQASKEIEAELETLSKQPIEEQLPSKAEIEALRQYWQKEKQNPTMEYVVKGLPDVCLGILSDAEKIINQHPAQRAANNFQTKKTVFTLIDNGGTRIIKIPKQVTKLEAALLTAVFEKEINNNSPAKIEAEKALKHLKATPIALEEFSDHDQAKALQNIFLFSVTNSGHVFSRNEFGDLQSVKAFREGHH